MQSYEGAALFAEVAVVPIAMFYESIVGISARLFQAFQFFQRQWKLTSEQS